MKKINFYIKKYLENRPLFHAFIRPQEASLFYQNNQLVKSPSLDFGCGDGFFAQTVFGKNKINVGLDLKKSRINQAKGVYKKLMVYGGVKIPYPNNYFKSVISNCVLEHVPNLKSSLKDIFRILKPRGYFVTTVMTDKWEKYIFGKQFMRKVQQHHNLFSENKWQKTFKEIGFKIVEKVGYLSQSSARYNEIFHYLSLPSLISYKLYGKWVLCPNMFTSSTIINTINKNISIPVERAQSAAIFFVLQKS